MQDARDLLKTTFGFDDFRPGQAEIIESILNGEEALAIMPTGGGKSLCFQLPALMREGITLVISPLIALMRDQVQALRALGVEAGALTSANDDEENERIFSAIDDGRLKLLYLAPERLSSASALLRRIKVSFLAVDEAHCVSQWGHDFRPDYLKIGDLRSALGNPQIAAFTATADAETRTEISGKLFADPPRLFLQGFDRPNIHLAFAAKASPRQQLLKFATARKGRSGIVYASSRNKTEVLAKALSDAGIPALPYHAGLDAEVRQIHQDRFQREDLVICATVAFGMGVDKPDIRYVAHSDLPKSMESYYQEIGRAGRDGAPAETLTLYGLEDIKLRRMQIDESPAPDERKRADHDRLNALLALAEAPRCRRQTLLAYFGDELAEPCGACDLCDTPPKLFDGTEAAQKALSAIYRTEERYGVEHLIQVLRGETSDKIVRANHDQLAVFGLGKDKDKNWWRGVFRQIYALGLTWIDPDRYGAWRLSESARPVLRGEQSIELRADTVKPASRSSSSRSAPAALLNEADEPVFTALKALRRKLAEAQNVPAYVVFPDRTLIDMATRRPTTLDELAACNGVGGKKLARYGADFLAALTDQPSEKLHPKRVEAAADGGGALFDALHEAQLELARGAGGNEKFLSCNRTTLAKIVEARPTSHDALGRISGMGEHKVDRFGDVFLSLIAANP